MTATRDPKTPSPEEVVLSVITYYFGPAYRPRDKQEEMGDYLLSLIQESISRYPDATTRIDQLQGLLSMLREHQPVVHKALFRVHISRRRADTFYMPIIDDNKSLDLATALDQWAFHLHHRMSVYRYDFSPADADYPKSARPDMYEYSVSQHRARWIGKSKTLASFLVALYPGCTPKKLTDVFSSQIDHDNDWKVVRDKVSKINSGILDNDFTPDQAAQIKRNLQDDFAVVFPDLSSN